MRLARKHLALMLLTLPPTVVSALTYFVGGSSVVTALCVGLHALTPAPRGPRKHLFAVSKVKGRVGLTDLDRNGHCNNARFLRECAFGRRDLWQYNGVWKVIVAAGGNLVVGSQTVRYRRELSFGQAYTMQTRLLCWDKRAFYVEHRFVTKSVKGNFVNAIVLVKNTVLGPLNPAQIVAKLPALQSDENSNPSMLADVVNWIASNEASSQMLRAEDDATVPTLDAGIKQN